ncbi:MAG: class I tRNA ligase family protein [Jatrophihabitantaceae bacterium]
MTISRIPRTLDELELPTFLRSASPAWAQTTRPPFNVRRVTLRPGETTPAHNHHDTEVWVVLAGRGEVRADGRVEAVQAGDAVCLTPLSTHSLRNVSDEQPLNFLSLWWEDLAALAVAHEQRTRPQPDSQRPVVLLPSFPTPNGDLHLGHIAGPYLAADVTRRWLISQGTPVRTLLGTVGFQSQVSAAAAAAGIGFYELAERNTEAIMRSLTAAGVGWDVFVRPSAPRYRQLAQQVFEQVLASGAVVVKTLPSNYCQHCARYLFEAYLAGSCPHCGSSDTAGIECEACAMPFADIDLVDPHCASCRSPAVRRDLTRYVFPLEPLRERITQYLSSVAMSARLRSYTNRVLARPLPDLPVSIAAEDGIPLDVPLAGNGRRASQQRMYSAFELAARYITALDELARGEGGAGWLEYVQTEQPRTVLFFGFDNAFLRAIVFPAVLGCLQPGPALPDTMICNEFYLLDNAKFSTGRAHAIWARDAFQPETQDQLRLYLASTRPDIRRRNFASLEYAEFARTEWQSWRAWLAGVDARLHSHFGAVAPEAGGWDAGAERFYEDLRELVAGIRLAYRPEDLSLAAAADSLRTFVNRAHRFAESCADGLDGPAADGMARTRMALELMAVRAFAAAAAPLTPAIADRLARAVGLGEPASSEVSAALLPDPELADGLLRWVPAGTPVSLATVLPPATPEPSAPDRPLPAALTRHPEEVAT